MATERNYFVRRFEPVLGAVPDQDKALVEALIRPLEPATAFFRAQRAEGFYGGLTLRDDLPLNGDSPYTVIRSNGEHRVYGYGEVEPYRKYLRDIARRMEDAIGVAIDIHDPEKDIFEATLKPMSQALKEGDFARAMILSLNTRLTPRYDLAVGLLDRYLDPRGLKLVMQGWLQRIDPEQNRYFNDLAHQLLRNPVTNFRVVFGDMLAAGGMTIEKPWVGNTRPSEDGIRRKVGADSHVFPNNLEAISREIVRPAVRRYLPQVTRSSGWEESIDRAATINAVAHETGHAQLPFDEETINILGGRYMSIKELMAELLGVIKIARLPRSVVHFSLKQMVEAYSLARWRSRIDEYLQEEDPDKRVIAGHYALAGAWRMNSQEREGGIRVNADDTIEVPDWERFEELDSQFYQELFSAVRNERAQPGFVEALIGLNSRVPRVYIENGQDS